MAKKPAKKKSPNTGSPANKAPQKSTVLAKAEAKAEKIVNASSDKQKGGKKNGAGQYFKELRSEFKKVVWPSRKTVVNNTAVVLISMILSGLVIWGLDSCFAALLNMVVSK